MSGEKSPVSLLLDIYCVDHEDEPHSVYAWAIYPSVEKALEDEQKAFVQFLKVFTHPSFKPDGDQPVVKEATSYGLPGFHTSFPVIEVPLQKP